MHDLELGHVVDENSTSARPQVVLLRRTYQLESVVWYAVLGVVLLVEAASLHSAASTAVAPFYPVAFDQVQYLAESYTGYELLRHDGLLSGTAEVLAQPRAQGMLAQFEAAALFLATGPGRLAALDLNVAFFLIYLAVTAQIVRRSLGVAPALLAVGLIVCAKSTRALAGGVFDFRLDFQAMCLWGTLVGLVVLGLGTSDRKRLVGACLGLATVWLCLTRIIATTYVVGFLAAMLAVTVVVGQNSRVAIDRVAAVRRSLAAPLIAAVVVAAGFIAQNSDLISAYYIGGHVVGDEKHLRALDAGAATLVTSLAFYPRSLLLDHAGLVFALLVVPIVFFSGVSFVASGRRVVLGALRANAPTVFWITGGLVLGLLAPYAVMTADEAKSSVVGNVFLPVLVLGVVCTFAAACRVPLAFARQRGRAAMIVASIVLAGSLGWQWVDLQRTVYDPQRLAEMTAASRFMTDIGDYVERTSHGHATWASDAHVDFAPVLVTRLYYFEQRHVWLDLASNLGDGPLATTLPQDVILQQAAASDVLLLTAGFETIYPYDLSIQQARPALLELAGQRFRPFQQFRIRGIDVSTYVRAPGQ